MKKNITDMYVFKFRNTNDLTKTVHSAYPEIRQPQHVVYF